MAAVTTVTATFGPSVPPSLSASPATVAAGAPVSAQWAGIASPTPRDWIALFAPGAADTAYLAWTYVNCSQAPGAAAAAGTCALTIPSNGAPGSYQLRLFANDGMTRLATSNTFTVTAALALTVTNAGTGSGTVTSAPVGITCGTSCSANYNSGTAVTLTATPATGSTFSGWSGGGCSGTGSCTVTMSAATAVTATFGVSVRPSLTASPAAVGAGGTVSVQWAGITSPTPRDWIGLFVPGAADTAFVAWTYVSCSQTPGTAAASGTCGFTIPSNRPPGTYELRLFANDSSVRLATSNTVTVITDLSVSPATVAAGGAVTVQWAGIASPTPRDWIGLYRTGTVGDSAFLAWMYVSCSSTPGLAAVAGSCIFTTPVSLAPGLYEFRLFANDGLIRLRTSNGFTVTP